MRNTNVELFTTLLIWLERQIPCWLCTVTTTWGSSPRPVGSLMLVNQQGEQIGSLSGGCIEEALITQLQTQPVLQPIHIIYGESEEEHQRFKLPCGGVVGVLIEPINASQKSHWLKIQQALLQNQSITRRVNNVLNVYDVDLSTSQPAHFNYDGKNVVNWAYTIGTRTPLFIIGANDVAQALAELSVWMDFEVIVCDPNVEKFNHWPIQQCQLLNMLPDEALAHFAQRENLHIVAVSHDPKVDDMGLLEAFQTKAVYIGAMGSKKTSQNRYKRLLQLGVNKAQLARLHAPIGLDIGSKTPKEIAIAILAELVRSKYKSL